MPDCNKCIWSTRDGQCVSWTCDFVSHYDARKMIAEKGQKAPEIVHCGECEHYKIDHPKANGYHCCYRCHNIFPMKEDDFCSRAVRRTDD